MSVLASGSFGRVVRVQHRLLGKEYVIKRSATGITEEGIRRAWCQVRTGRQAVRIIARLNLQASCCMRRLTQAIHDAHCSITGAVAVTPSAEGGVIMLSSTCTGAQESQAWAHVRPHPNIVRFYDAWMEPAAMKPDGAEHCFIWLEKCGETVGAARALRRRPLHGARAAGPAQTGDAER